MITGLISEWPANGIHMQLDKTSSSSCILFSLTCQWPSAGWYVPQFLRNERHPTPTEPIRRYTKFRVPYPQGLKREPNSCTQYQDERIFNLSRTQEMVSARLSNESNCCRWLPLHLQMLNILQFQGLHEVRVMKNSDGAGFIQAAQLHFNSTKRLPTRLTVQSIWIQQCRRQNHLANSSNCCIKFQPTSVSTL